MAHTRRDFLKIAGLSGIVLTCPPVVSFLTAQTVPQTASPARRATQAAPLKAGNWAMTVLVGKCKPGCRDCILACHTEHNVPAFGNPQHNINWIDKRPYKHVFPGATHSLLPETIKGLSVPVLCNHCDNPPCVRVCPTQATFKRKDGIIMMDYHRCIGCRFCMAACPYGSRSMNYRDPRPFIKKITPHYPTRTIGVVEKCNFCEDRLVRGLLPACVTACRAKAMTFGDLDDPRSEVRRLLGAGLSLQRKPELGTGPRVYYIL